MTKAKEILTKAIEKAVTGGWDYNDKDYNVEAINFFDNEQYSFEAIIFNHDFAKALWGEKPNTPYLKAASYIPWKYHLRRMVLANDPIKYLGANL